MTSAPRPSVRRAHLLDEVGGRVVDPVVEPEVGQAGEPLGARGGGQHRGAGPLGQLDGGDPDAAGTGVDEGGLARLRAARTRTGSRRPCRRGRARTPPPRSATPSGIGQQKGRPVTRSSACEPSSPTVTTRSPGARSSTPSPTSTHDAGALVADDVGNRREVAAQPVEGVAALDADRLHPDQDVARPAGRVGHVLVAEHVGAARLVVHRCLHGSSLRSAARHPRQSGVDRRKRPGETRVRQGRGDSHRGNRWHEGRRGDRWRRPEAGGCVPGPWPPWRWWPSAWRRPCPPPYRCRPPRRTAPRLPPWWSARRP